MLGKNQKKIFIKIAAAACAALTLALTGCSAKAIQQKPSVKLDKSSLSVLAGATGAIASTVSPSDKTTSGKWSSDNPTVATVADGVVTGVAAGNCKVTFSCDGAKASCQVTVSPSSTQTTVLMYHSIAYEPSNKLRVPAEDFDKEMKWLRDNDYTALTPDELCACLTGKTPFPQKSVMITLDDGYSDNYDNMYPTIKKYGLHATVFMITSKIDTNGFLSRAQLKEMSDSGYVSVESHTVTHPALSDLSYSAQLKEMTDAKKTLEDLTGKPVDYLAYPSGKYNKDSIAAAKATGYKLCFLMEGGTGGLTTDPYEFPRAFVDKNLNTLIDAANGLGD